MKLSTFDFFKNLPPDTDGAVALTPEQIGKLHEVLLMMLDDIVSVCRENGIVYTLGGGSVLGALRHGGFIPWDDDIDLNFPRAELERFIPAFRKRFPEKYTVQSPQETEGYSVSMYKVRLNGTVMRGRDDFAASSCGVGIDLFPMENTFDNPVLRKLQGVAALGMGYLLSCRKFYEYRTRMRKLCESLPEARKAFELKIFIGRFLSPLSLAWWCRAADSWHRICRNDRSEYVSGCAGRLHFFGELYRRADICTPREVLFEGRTVNIPKEAEAYLTHCYGDWRKPPEENAREKHYVIEFQL